MEPQLRFDGKVAIITGAGRGLGREYALLLAARGAKVVVNDLGVAISDTDGSGEAPATNPADDVVAEIAAAGGEAVANHDTIATADGGAAIVAAAVDAFGTVDVVVNNAGQVRMQPFGDVPRRARGHRDRHPAAGHAQRQPAGVADHGRAGRRPVRQRVLRRRLRRLRATAASTRWPRPASSGSPSPWPTEGAAGRHRRQRGRALRQDPARAPGSGRSRGATSSPTGCTRRRWPRSWRGWPTRAAR